MLSYKNLAITALVAFVVSPALSAPIESSPKQSRAEIAPHPLLLYPMVPGAVPPAPEPSGGGSKRATDAPESRAIAELEGRYWPAGHGGHGEAAPGHGGHGEAAPGHGGHGEAAAGHGGHGEEAAVTPKEGMSGKGKTAAIIGGGALALFAAHEYGKAHSAPPPDYSAAPPDNSAAPPANSAAPPPSPYGTAPPPYTPPPYTPPPYTPPPYTPSSYSATPPGNYVPPPGNYVPPSPYNTQPSPASYNVQTPPPDPNAPPPGSKRDNAVLLAPLSSKGLSGVHELGQRDIPSPEAVAGSNALNQRAEYTPEDVAPRPLGRALNELD